MGTGARFPWLDIFVNMGYLNDRFLSWPEKNDVNSHVKYYPVYIRLLKRFSLFLFFKYDTSKSSCTLALLMNSSVA